MVAAWRRRFLARPPAYDAGRPVAFMHVPKTAGSSLIAALVEALRPSAVVSGFDTVLFGAFRDFSSLAPDLQALIYQPGAGLPQAPLVAGHIAYSTLRASAPSGQIVTVLRHPMSRLLSHWLFWRGHSEERLQPWGAWGDAVRLARLPLADFLAAPALACQNDNLATRMLLWPHALIPDGGFIAPSSDRKLLAQALRRLDSLAFTGVVEDAELASKLSQFFGATVSLPSENRTIPLPAPLRGALDEELTNDACARLTRLSRLDRALWQATVEKHCPGLESSALQEQTLARNVARFAALMAGA